MGANATGTQISKAQIDATHRALSFALDLPVNNSKTGCSIDLDYSLSTFQLNFSYLCLITTSFLFLKRTLTSSQWWNIFEFQKQKISFWKLLFSVFKKFGLGFELFLKGRIEKHGRNSGSSVFFFLNKKQNSHCSSLDIKRQRGAKKKRKQPTKSQKDAKMINLDDNCTWKPRQKIFPLRLKSFLQNKHIKHFLQIKPKH